MLSLTFVYLSPMGLFRLTFLVIGCLLGMS